MILEERRGQPSCHIDQLSYERTKLLTAPPATYALLYRNGIVFETFLCIPGLRGGLSFIPENILVAPDADNADEGKTAGKKKKVLTFRQNLFRLHYLHVRADWHCFFIAWSMPSTVIRYHFYNNETNTLTIVFVSGLRYEYLGVSPSTYEQFKAASSKGTYFNEHIKPQHECRRQE